MRFILASQSPARRQLLQLAGIEPECIPSNFDEDSIQSRNPAHLVETLALLKAQTVAQTLSRSAIVLGCDSVLAINGEIHGKPTSHKDATERWRFMRGRVGEIYTGHALIEVNAQGRMSELVRCGMTQVHFAQVSDAQIAAYVATGEPMNRAGCFSLEGKGSMFVEKLQGCHTNVIGLSMPLLRQMMMEMGHDVTKLWR
jgi:septum formation protein